MIDWTELLRHWSADLMASDLAAAVDPPPESPDWLGHAPATDADIDALQARLGLVLPPSYVAFLKASNGWRRITFAIGRLRPAAEVDWFHVENEQWADIYADDDGGAVPNAEHFAYTDNGAHGHRAADMRHLVQVSDVDDGVLLLNPRAVTPDGEWEAWFFANWVPGAQRHPAFVHLMLSQFRSFREVQKVPGGGWALPALQVPAPAVKRKAAKRVSKSRSSKTTPVTTDELLPMLESPDVRVRRRAVRTLAGRVGGHGGWAVPRPDLVEPLTAIFDRSGDADVRAVCVSALTEVAPDGEGPPPLLASLTDPDPGVVLSGIFALNYFPDPRAIMPLCRFIESGVNALINESAMSALAELAAPAAVPTLAKVMTNTANPFDQSFGTAGIALGRIASPAAVEALIAGLGHADPRVRFAAVVGLDVSGDPRAPGLIDQMAGDPNEKVRRRAGQRMGRWPTNE